jgi:hypothetical protein
MKRQRSTAKTKGDKRWQGVTIRSRLPRRASCSVEDVLPGCYLIVSDAVEIQTDAGHRQEVMRWRKLAKTNGLKMTTDAEVDGTRVFYCNKGFPRGANGHPGHRILAAYMTVHPEFGPLEHWKQSPAHLALKGWDRRAPGYTRTPEALPVGAAIAVRLIAQGYRVIGCWVLGRFDGSGLWFSPHRVWGGAFFRGLRSWRRMDEPRRPVSAAELQEQVRAVTVELGWHDLRPDRWCPSEASRDRRQGYRVLAEVKKRGSWKAVHAVDRYEKARQVGAERYVKEAGLKAYCEMCDTGLRWMTRGAVLPSPPAGPRDGSWKTSSRDVAASAPRRRR